MYEAFTNLWIIESKEGTDAKQDGNTIIAGFDYTSSCVMLDAAKVSSSKLCRILPHFVERKKVSDSEFFDIIEMLASLTKM